MKYSDCTPAYACEVIREIIDDNPSRVALDLIALFLDNQAEVEEVLDL